MRALVLNRGYWLFPVGLWTLLVFASLWWNLREVDTHSTHIVLERARLMREMSERLQHWSGDRDRAAMSVPPAAQYPPKADSGTALSSLSAESVEPGRVGNEDRNDIHIHLFSFHPVDPKNAPLPWEEEVLRRFEADAELMEWSGLSGEGDEPVFRYIAPLIVERSCLDCHYAQEYKVGGIAGGVSIDVPPGSLPGAEVQRQHPIIWVHLGLWLLPTGLMLFGLSRHRRQLLHLQGVISQQDSVAAARSRRLQQEVFQREEAQERLNRFIESSGEGMLVVDCKGCCTLVNSAALGMLGYSVPAQLVGRCVTDFLCPNEEGCRRATQQHAREACVLLRTLGGSAAIYDDDYRFLRADNSTFAVALNTAPILVDGRRLGSVITFSDVSERKAKEMALRKLSRAVEFSPATTMITDAQGMIEYVNRRFTESSGYAAQEVIGKKPGLMRSGKTPREIYESLWRHIRAGLIWHGEILNRKKGGELFWEDISISPINDDEGRITHYVAVKEDISERKRQQEQAWRLANYDSLTGLINRRYFLARLEQSVAQAQRYDTPFALLFLDLDGFKYVNDRLGHDAGDALLSEASRRLQGGVRESDTVARLGGDEFTIIMPMVADRAAVDVCAQKVLASLNRSFNIRGHEVHVSASIGIALFPEHGTSSDDLLNHADEAMYAAKASGKNAYRWFKG